MECKFNNRGEKNKKEKKGIMVKKEHLERLKKHRDSALKSFDNLIEITNKDIDKSEKEGEEGDISLNDDKIKTYAEGLLKSHQAIEQLTSLLDKLDIEISEIELEPSLKEEKQTKSDKKNETQTTSSSLSANLH